MKKVFILSATILLVLTTSSFSLAVDDATVIQIQNDATEAKGKADKNAADIENMKGGLPALQDQVNKILLTPGPIGPEGPMGPEGPQGVPGTCSCDIIRIEFDALVQRITALEQVIGCPDNDQDGFTSQTCGGPDCNDQDPSINPAAQEICDSIDNNCDGVIDNKDIDQDGYIDENCIDASGNDCDDLNNSINPGAAEIFGDSIDNNCDGNIDEEEDDYSHTIFIDGINDFSVIDEEFATTSSNYYGYVAWDTTFLYVGMEGVDIGANDSNTWVLIYIGGPVGTTLGVAYDNQSPTIPFNAAYHIRWRSDNQDTSAMNYDGSSWQETNWNFTGEIANSGTFMEIRIPLANIGVLLPTTVRLHISIVNTTQNNEDSFAGIPDTTFTDGFDPDYTTYYSFDLGSSSVPNSHIPQ